MELHRRNSGAAASSSQGCEGATHDYQRRQFLWPMEVGSFIAISYDGTTAHIDQTNTQLALRGYKLFRENLRRVLKANLHVSKVTLNVEDLNDDAQEVSHIQQTHTLHMREPADAFRTHRCTGTCASSRAAMAYGH